MGYDTTDKDRRKAYMDVPQIKHRQNKFETIVHNENDAADRSSEHATQMEAVYVTE